VLQFGTGFLFLCSINQLLNAMTNYYENVPLEEYEGILANREYWDNASCEWESYSKMEVKLARLGTFVQRGGDLNRVIARYAEDREYTYRVMVQHCLERYIEALADKRIPNITLRIYKLEKEEAVKLLAELLKACIKRTCEYDKYKKEYYSLRVVETKNVDVESILATIEEEHSQAHPNETKEEIKARVMNWIRESWW
jgi:undecaprenyl pyrophosphate synthase